MSGKINRIYEALVGGAEAGLSGDALFKHVMGRCSNASSKKIVKASLLALSDPDLKDANILQVVYALAIKHRLDPVSKGDLEVGEGPLGRQGLDQEAQARRNRGRRLVSPAG